MEADERTALLGNGEAANSTRLTVDYPPLRVAVDELLLSGSLPDDVPDLPASFSLGAYHVMALLSAVQELSKAADSPVDLEEMYVAQDQERKGGELAEKAQWQCKQVLANVTSNNDLEVLMWTPILEQESSSRYVRFMDFLVNPVTAPLLLESKECEFFLSLAWRQGRAYRTHSGDVTGNLISRLERLAAPRALHLLDLVGNVAYLGLLLSYLLDPPYYPATDDSDTRHLGARVTVLAVYALSNMVSYRSLRTLTFFLVFVAYLLRFPGFPNPGDATFDLLLMGFVLNVIFLHMPAPATPIFLFSADTVLPLVTVLWSSVTHTLVPVLGFFLPAIFLSANLLSVSLADVFLQLFAGVQETRTAAAAAAPVETRAAFLALFFVLIFLFISSTVTMVLASPANSLQHTQAAQWDRYGVVVGLEARRLFARAVAAYLTTASGRSPFPAPFNLLPLLLVRIPLSPARLFAARGTEAICVKVERVIWLLTVAPLAAVVNALWILFDGKS